MRTRGPKNAPTAIHLAGLLRTTAISTAEEILKVRDNKFPSYHQPLKKWISNALNGYRDNIDGLIRQAEKMPETKKYNATLKNLVLEILPLMADFLSNHNVKFFTPLNKKIYYRLTKQVNVPISPIGAIRVDDRVLLAFTPTWKNTRLTAQQFRIWSTIVMEAAIKNNPDYDGFIFISMPNNPDTNKRELIVRTDLDAVDSLTPLEFSGVRTNLEHAMKIVNETSAKPRKPREKPDASDQQAFDF